MRSEVKQLIIYDIGENETVFLRLYFLSLFDLTGQKDLVNARILRQSLDVRAHHLDAVKKGVQSDEFRNVNGGKEMADVLRVDKVVPHIVEVRAELCAAENTAENVDEQGNAVALMPADRKHGALLALGGVCGGTTVRRDGPALGDRLAELGGKDYLAHGDNAQRDVQQQRGAIATRCGDRQRIGAHIGAVASGRSNIRRSIADAEADHTGLCRHFGIMTGHAEVIGMLSCDHAAARLAGFFDAALHCAHTGHYTHMGTMGWETLQLLKEDGAIMEKTVLCHTNKMKDINYFIKLLDTGANLCFEGADRPMWATDTECAENILRLVEMGYQKQLLLSMDAGRNVWQKGYMKRQGKIVNGISYLLTDFVPLMRKVGVSDEAIMDMLVHNPARVLSLS